MHDPLNRLFAWAEDEGEGASQITPDPVCVQKFLEQYRYAFVKKQKLIYTKDGYSYIGHYAKNIKLLDGNTYKKIHVSINQDLSAIPLKLTLQMKAGSNCYYWGNILSIYNNDKNNEFSKYLYPSAEE